MQTAVIWTLMNATPFPPLHGENVERDGAFRLRGQLPVRQVFVCRDGHVSLLMNPRTLSGLTAWMSEEGVGPDWLYLIDWDEWDVTAAARGKQKAIEQFGAIQREVEEYVATKSKDELFMRAIAYRMLLAPCHTVEDIALSEQLAARDFWREIGAPRARSKADSPGAVGQVERESDSDSRVPLRGWASTTSEILSDVDSRELLWRAKEDARQAIVAQLGHAFRRDQGPGLYLGRSRADNDQTPG